MRDVAHRQDVIDKTLAAFGKLDVLVVNHGVGTLSKGLDDVTEASFDLVLNVNTKSALFLIKAAVRHLEETKGCIVVTSSILSTMPYASMIEYNMSKAALDHMVRCLALELGPKGIRINAINPTIVQTSFFRDCPEDFFTSEAGKFFAASHPLGGCNSQPEEQADVIAFLASDAARFITGECIKVDASISAKGNAHNYFVPGSNPTAAESEQKPAE